ncbi:MAG: tetratricopeptide repeat protein, partial [Gemmataceae bacterium]
VRNSVIVNRGQMYFNQGQDQRIRQAKQAQDQFARAIGQYHQAIALQPNQYQAHVNLAQLYQTQGRLGDALENLDRAIELHDRDASLYRTRGLLQLRCGNEQAALDDLDRAIALAPPGKSANLAADFIERGRILFRRKRYDAALESFEQAQRFHPEEFPRAHRLRAEALLELGQHTEALQAINRNLTRGGDDDHDAYLTRGLIRSKLARYHEAIADYTLALDAPPAKGTDPAEIDKIRAKTLAYRGWAYLILDAIRVAEHDFDEALKLDDQNGDAHSGRGNARIKQGKHESALVDIEASLKLGKPSSRLSYNAARCYALAVDAVGKNAAFDRAKLAQAQFYQSRALDLLRAALDQVPEAERAAFIKDYVETDPAWLALRRNSRFAEIVASGSR